MSNYLNFVLVAAALVLVPGPDYILVTKNTLSTGKFGGFKTLAGTCCALLAHTAFAVLGLSAIIAKSAVLFSFIKILGACYLLYLGLRSLLSKPDHAAVTSEKTDPQGTFSQGFVTNLLNPKVAVFFLTFLPQFIAPGNPSWLPFALLGSTYVALTFGIYGCYILFLEKVRHFFENQRTQYWLNKISGGILLLFGLRLFMEKSS